ncbi:MAG: bifunctional riboflavin kinase/FAD synthetase [Actinobacteria bacterium]|nr:bifunctional riboflavin kinase/FAD synthetase [Actinomycetota bacterium]
MRIIDGLEAMRTEAVGSTGASVVIGTFDGVHLGHRRLIEAGVGRARAGGWVPICVTWDRHPTQTLAPAMVPPLITPFARRQELVAALGLEALVVLAFDEAFTTWSPERFVTEVLVEGLGARAVGVGKGFRFGHRAAGDTALLERLGEREGFRVEAEDLLEVGGSPVSSTRVRAAIAAGDLAEVKRLLGRPWDLDGVVLRGDRRGTSLGYPTANIGLAPSLAQPPSGVYAGRARTGGAWFTAAVNVGINPTFASETPIHPRLEAYLIGFSGDLYGRPVRVELWERLRDELRFASAEDLVAQISRDVLATRKVVEGSPMGSTPRDLLL